MASRIPAEVQAAVALYAMGCTLFAVTFVVYGTLFALAGCIATPWMAWLLFPDIAPAAPRGKLAECAGVG